MKKKYDIKKLERAFSEDFSSPLYSMLANIYFNKKDFDREVRSRVEGYGYQVTDDSMIPQFYNSGMGMAC